MKKQVLTMYISYANPFTYTTRSSPHINSTVAGLLYPLHRQENWTLEGLRDLPLGTQIGTEREFELWTESKAKIKLSTFFKLFKVFKPL